MLVIIESCRHFVVACGFSISGVSTSYMIPMTGALVAFHHEVKTGKITKWRLSRLKVSWEFRGMTVPGFRLLIPEMFSNTFHKELTRSMIALVTMKL